jgi:CheY-like chemotaxis protein/anti-sigma regulatory factor (Ser/Thr protein kinase)
MKKILVVDDDRVTRHVLRKVLTSAGFSLSVAKDGVEALKVMKNRRFDLLLLDVWMPRMNGLELLARLRRTKTRPRIIIMTSDEAPQTLLEAVREQAFRYVHKPVEALALLQTVREVLKAAAPPPVDVISARPEWVELVVPCTREAAERIQTVMAQLDANLPTELRDSIGYAFRELLLNAVEWGGRLDPKRKVRIACLRTRRMLMYRIADPGAGFKIDDLPHAAIGQAPDDPIAHVYVREEKGLRPGGFGLLMVRASVDELIYNEKRNEVVFVKYLDDGTASREASAATKSSQREAKAIAS